MDRRRRAPGGAQPSKPVPRPLRRPLALLRRLVAAPDLAYVLISLALLGIVALVIIFATSSSTAPVPYPILSSRRHLQAPVSDSAASGSVRELDALLARVVNSSQSQQGDKPGKDRLVITVAVNYAYRRLALNFVCNLNRLNLSNYVILAMDHAVHEYLGRRGANVFFYEQHNRRALLFDIDTTFGSPAFAETSRRKSMLVLKVLRLRYSVVFSDVDVVWVRNPIPELLRHQSDFIVQSDRMHSDRDAALNYNLNSGFYLVRSSLRAMTALQAIVKYALAIRRSEQKAFNYVLCGAFKDHHAGPGLRVGSHQCTYRKGGTTAEALSLDAFPNGSDESLWQNSSVPFEKANPEVVAVHANYVEGLARKVERIRRIGYWFLSDDPENIDACVLPSSSSA